MNYEKIEAQARKVLMDCYISTPPVSPIDIAESNGIGIEHVAFLGERENVAGAFDFDKNKIYVNSKDSYYRKAFTIAHELGHFFLHKDKFKKNPELYKVLMRKPIGVGVSEGGDEEREAHVFAALLLVPKEMLDLYQHRLVSDIATIFAVPQDVIRYRIKTEYGN